MKIYLGLVIDFGQEPHARWQLHRWQATSAADEAATPQAETIEHTVSEPVPAPVPAPMPVPVSQPAPPRILPRVPDIRFRRVPTADSTALGLGDTVDILA